MSDWIKIDKRLIEKPEVFQLAEKMGICREQVVGHLYRFWDWCDEHLSCPDDSCNVSVTLGALRDVVIDVTANFSGFTKAMVLVGWLKDENGEYFVPHFDRHLSKSAKKRFLASERVRKFRNASSVTKALPEEKRDDKSIVPISSTLKTSRLDYKEIQTRYNRAAEISGVRKSKLWSDRIKVGLAARCKEFPNFINLWLDQVEHLDSWVAEESWFEFGWALVSNENARKLLEGKYRGVQAPVRKTEAELLAEYHAELKKNKAAAAGNGGGGLDLAGGKESQDLHGSVEHPW